MDFKRYKDMVLSYLRDLENYEKQDIEDHKTLSDDEKEDFERIQNQLAQISIAVDSLQLWVQKAVADGKIT